jgi:hypothetical protein
MPESGEFREFDGAGEVGDGVTAATEGLAAPVGVAASVGVGAGSEAEGGARALWTGVGFTSVEHADPRSSTDAAITRNPLLRECEM